MDYFLLAYYGRNCGGNSVLVLSDAARGTCLTCMPGSDLECEREKKKKKVRQTASNRRKLSREGKNVG